jgi:hypothetical protein
MTLTCESCGAQNPATNHYCGQCGGRLEQTATDMPEEFWRRTEPGSQLEASADLPPEVIEFDNQIPLFAGEGTDRRLHPPAEIVEELHDHLEREAEMHDQLRHGEQTHFEAAKLESDRIQDESEEADPRKSNEFQPYHSGETVLGDANGYAVPAPAHRNFLAEGEKASRTGVSGPSFLGLTDDTPPDYSDEEPEPESHLRRNIGLAVLACVIFLAALQWQSIRDIGVSYMQNGSIAMKPTQNAAPQNPPAIAANNVSRDANHDPTAPPAKSDSPQALNSSPNADRNLPVQQADKSPNPATPVQNSASSESTTQQPPAMSAPIADVPRINARSNPPNDDVSRSNPSNNAAKSTPAPSASRTPIHRVSSAVPVAGAEEMSRASNASDAEARAAWLWRAVARGNPRAPVELATMYERGYGVVRNCDQAKILLRMAAAKGSEEARLNLQQIRFHGGCSAH